MTAPIRAPGVHAVGQIILEVPDLKKALSFYEAFGLTPSPAGADIKLSGSDAARPELRLTPGGKKRLRTLVLLASDDALASIRTAADARGVLRESSRGKISLFDPDGNQIEVHASSSDFRPSPALRVDAPALPRRLTKNAAPLRLSHVMLQTPDVTRAVAFYRDVLGVSLSDHAGDIVAFTHGSHGGDHHMIAFAKSHAPAFHHMSWQVAALDDVGLGARQMHDAGFVEGWGVGRHVLGSNYFYYARDPWGSFCEFSYGIDQIEPSSPWIARDHAPEDALYLWGPDVPDYFLANSEHPNDG